MGFFLWNGKNKIMDDLIKNLPLGQVYFEEANVVPYTTAVSQTGHGMLAYTEQFDSTLYPIGTDVKIYINDKLFATVQILPTHTVYLLLNPPYGNFKLRTEINGQIYREEQYISTNIFAFFVVLAQTYNWDYKKIFEIFGNIYDKYLQDDMLFDKIGWYYDFAKPTGWSYEDYRKVMTGWNSTGDATISDTPVGVVPFIPAGSPIYRPINQLFLNAMSIYAVQELCRSFTGTYPLIETYRDIDGWVIDDETLISNSYGFWPFKFFYLLDGVTGNKDISSLSLNGKSLNLLIKGINVPITFTAPTTATDIINQINTALTAVSLYPTSVKAEIRTYTYDYLSGTTLNQYLRFNNLLETGEGLFNEGDFIVVGGTAVALLGLEVGEEGLVETGNDLDEIICLYDEQYHNIKLTIKKGIYTVTETLIRNVLTYVNTKDKLKHRFVLNTTGHPFPITITVGATTYNITTDYTLYNFPGTDDWYVEWLTLTPPIDGTAYTVTYTYYISDEIKPLIEKIKPAFLQVEYIMSEN
jgi:hypothetical protein